MVSFVHYSGADSEGVWWDGGVTGGGGGGGVGGKLLSNPAVVSKFHFSCKVLEN